MKGHFRQLLLPRLSVLRQKYLELVIIVVISQFPEFMEISTIGFLGVHHFEQGAAIRGAILVTAMDTKPLEFRVTAPVRPQNFQSILYGELLNEHIAVDLVGLPLLTKVDNNPDLILVNDELLLGIASKQEAPTLRIMRADETLMRREIEYQTLNSLNASYPSVNVYTFGRFVESLKTIAEQLQVVFSQRDLMEPFERIERACSDVHERRLGEK